MHLTHWEVLAAAAALMGACGAKPPVITQDCADAPPKQPRIVGPWQRLAGDPDLGELTTPNQQPVDFGIWQAADGTWQLWSCIRATKEPGNTRLFYRWEGARLTDPDWKPLGIAMHADPKVGELPGGLQAPFVFRDRGRRVLFYGGWQDICSAESKDGKTFERILDRDGRATLFRAPGEYAQTRDPMVIRIGGLWHCYYTAHTGKLGADFCCTSRDLRTWSDARMVAAGGQAGSGNFSAECPFVVELERGQFYLFRTQRYGKDAQTSVYFSHDPMDFGINNDAGHFVCTLPVAAPEILKYRGRYYLAALLPSLKGIQIARLEWEVSGRPVRAGLRLQSPTSRARASISASPVCIVSNCRVFLKNQAATAALANVECGFQPRSIPSTVRAGCSGAGKRFGNIYPLRGQPDCRDGLIRLADGCVCDTAIALANVPLSDLVDYVRQFRCIE